MQSVVKHGEAASWDIKAAEAFVKAFHYLIKKKRIHCPASFQLR